MATKQNKKTSVLLSIIVSVIFFVFSTVFGIYLNSLKIFPEKYIIAYAIAMLIINVIVALLLLTKSRPWKKFASAGIIILILGLFVYGSWTLNSFDRFIDDSTAKDPDESSKSIYSVIVQKDDPLQSSLQVSNMLIGYEEKLNLEVASSLLPNNIGAGANPYKGYPALAGALLDGTERIIVFDEAYRGIIEEVYPGFLQKTRILNSTDQDYMRNLYAPDTNKTDNDKNGSTITDTSTTSHTSSSTSETSTSETSTNNTDEIINETNSTEDVTGDEGYEGSLETLPSEEVQEPELGDYQEYQPGVIDGVNPFTILITGIDNYGSVYANGRSDVNIAAAVNPQTRQVLLVPVPRDSYVAIAGTGGYMDKLTHAGILGPWSSANSVANALGIPMDGYVKVNFNTLIRLVDILGGITVYNPNAFASFPAGNIRLNGSQALAFSRNRKSLGGGDISRGMNQTRVIQGIINEILQNGNLLRANEILGAMSGSFSTNVSDGVIRTMIQNQLAQGGSWNVQSYGLSGYSQSGLPSYFMPNYRLSFIVLDQGSVAGARSWMYGVLGG